MATIYAHTNDGYVSRFNQSSWSNARASTTGTNVSSTATQHEFQQIELQQGGVDIVLIYIGHSFSLIHQESQLM